MFCQSQAYPTENNPEKSRFFWLFLFPKKAEGVQKGVQNFKICLQKAKLATMLHKN